jgi:hypothetical protein
MLKQNVRNLTQGTYKLVPKVLCIMFHLKRNCKEQNKNVIHHIQFLKYCIFKGFGIGFENGCLALPLYYAKLKIGVENCEDF